MLCCVLSRHILKAEVAHFLPNNPRNSIPNHPPSPKVGANVLENPLDQPPHLAWRHRDTNSSSVHRHLIINVGLKSFCTTLNVFRLVLTFVHSSINNIGCIRLPIYHDSKNQHHQFHHEQLQAELFRKSFPSNISVVSFLV